MKNIINRQTIFQWIFVGTRKSKFKSWKTLKKVRDIDIRTVTGNTLARINKIPFETFADISSSVALAK